MRLIYRPATPSSQCDDGPGPPGTNVRGAQRRTDPDRCRPHSARFADGRDRLRPMAGLLGWRAQEYLGLRCTERPGGQAFDPPAMTAGWPSLRRRGLIGRRNGGQQAVPSRTTADGPVLALPLTKVLPSVDIRRDAAGRRYPVRPTSQRVGIVTPGGRDFSHQPWVLCAQSQRGSPLVSAPTVSVVIPAMNEAENLPYVLPRIPTWVHEGDPGRRQLDR